ncbi:MAG: hypothetical protein ACF8QF_07770 [Phycisphaerales bacterium]
MPHVIARAPGVVGVAAALSVCAGAPGQTIDFETLPGGAPTVDQQEISTEYEANFGVSFALISRTTGLPIGLPRIAKVGTPQTAFASCNGADTPLPGQGIGDSFLTDNNSIGVAGDLLITYVSPVSAASGVVLDVDCRTPTGGPPCEQWTIEALDGAGAVLETAVIDGLAGPSMGTCADPNGAGDALAFGWSFSRASADIAQVRIRYTGTASSVGLGFDLFSPAQGAGPLSADADLARDAVCAGDAVGLLGGAVGGMPPYEFVWERDDGGVWTEVATTAEAIDRPLDDEVYRLRAIDSLGAEVIAGPLAVEVRPRRIMISQESAPGAGDFDANLLGEMAPVQTGDTHAAYHGWTSGAPSYQGSFPALVDDRAHLFGVRAADGFGIYLVLDDGVGPVGGRAETRFELTGTTGDFAVRDDASDASDIFSVTPDGSLMTVRNVWAPARTDGYVAGPLDGEWTGLLSFSDVAIGTPTVSGVTSWAAYPESGAPTALALAEDRRVRIVVTCPGCPSDFNGDGVTDGADLGVLLGAWGTPTGDLNGDGNTDGADLGLLLGAWGMCP